MDGRRQGAAARRRDPDRRAEGRQALGARRTARIRLARRGDRRREVRGRPTVGHRPGDGRPDVHRRLARGRSARGQAARDAARHAGHHRHARAARAHRRSADRRGCADLGRPARCGRAADRHGPDARRARRRSLVRHRGHSAAEDRAPPALRVPRCGRHLHRAHPGAGRRHARPRRGRWEPAGHVLAGGLQGRHRLRAARGRQAAARARAQGQAAGPQAAVPLHLAHHPVPGARGAHHRGHAPRARGRVEGQARPRGCCSSPAAGSRTETNR